MKAFALALTCVVLTAFGLTTQAQAQRTVRTWESADGKFKTRAMLVEQVNQTVRLRKEDGKVVIVPLDRLSAEDREYVRRQGDLPRIRLVYFVPADRTPAPAYEDRIRVVMKMVATLYRQSLDGYQLKSNGLQFQTREGKVVVHLVRGKRPAGYYNGSPQYDSQQQLNALWMRSPRTLAFERRM